MNILSTLIIGLGLLSNGMALEVGGVVPEVRIIECTLNPMIDTDIPVSDFNLLTCKINNNLANVEFSFKIDLPGIDVTSIKLIEVTGTRGAGLGLPMNHNLIPEMDGKKYRWTGTQNSATVDYVIQIRVDWVKSVTGTLGNPGIYVNMGNSSF